MLEMYDLIKSIYEKPWTWTSIIAILLFIVDKIFKQLFLRHIRKLLHIRDKSGVELHMQRLDNIERKLNLLLRESDLEWAVHDLTPNSQPIPKKKSILSQLLQAIRLRAAIAVKYIQLLGALNMDKINKLLLLPLITQVCVILKDAFGITVGTDQQDAIATGAALVIGLIGIWMNRHKKEGDSNDYISDSLERTE